MTGKLIYVNILVWNGEKWLKNCLDSVLASRYLDFKVIVVDNASSDNSCRIINENYPQVHLIKNKKNYGFAQGHNIGIRYALSQNADYIVLLNQDIIVDFLWLDKLVEAVYKHQEFDILTPFQYNYSGKEIDSHFLSRMLLYGRGFKEDYEKGALKEVYEHTCSLGAAMLVRKEVFLKVGLFDPYYFVYHEESDFLQRAFYHGFRIALVTASKINHWHSSLHSEEMSLKSKYFSYRNSFVVTLKNPQYSIFRNLIFCFTITGRYIRENINFAYGIGKICFIIYLQFLVLMLLPVIAYKRFWEKRKPCYL